jgi:hypothetical protein
MQFIGIDLITTYPQGAVKAYADGGIVHHESGTGIVLAVLN